MPARGSHGLRHWPRTSLRPDRGRSSALGAVRRGRVWQRKDSRRRSTRTNTQASSRRADRSLRRQLEAPARDLLGVLPCSRFTASPSRRTTWGSPRAPPRAPQPAGRAHEVDSRSRRAPPLEGDLFANAVVQYFLAPDRILSHYHGVLAVSRFLLSPHETEVTQALFTQGAVVSEKERGSMSSSSRERDHGERVIPGRPGHWPSFGSGGPHALGRNEAG